MLDPQVKDELEKLHPESFLWAVRCCFENQSAAADVLQNAYLKILEGRAVFNKQSSFKTWLFSVIRFTAIDFFKKEKKKNFYEEIIEEKTLSLIEDPEQNNLGNEALFKAALKQLSPQQSHVLHLVFYQNLTIQEAAVVMGIQLGTARTHYARGKKQLKKWLAKTNV